MAQNIKTMDRIKVFKRHSNRVRKENRPSPYSTTRRVECRLRQGMAAASSSRCHPDNKATEVGDEMYPSTSLSSGLNDQPLSQLPSWNLKNSTITSEESGVVPLPEEDSHDRGVGVFTVPSAHTLRTYRSRPWEESSQVLVRSKSEETIKRSDFTPGLATIPTAVLRAPKVLGNSQRENCLKAVSYRCRDEHAEVYYGMLTPPRSRLPLRKSEPPGPDYFQNLPDEIVLQIFQSLSRNTLSVCMRVCKRWSQVALDESFWRRIDLSPRKVRSYTLCQLITRGTTHLRLAKSMLPDVNLADIGSAFSAKQKISALQYVDLSMADVHVSMLVDIFSHCRNLKKVSLEHLVVNDDVLQFLAENHKLDTLNLAMCTGVSARGLNPIFVQCNELLELNLAWNGLEESSVSCVCKRAPNSLEKLNLSGCRNVISDQDVDALSKRCGNLLELDLSDSLHLTPASIDSICSNLLNLQCLSVNRCYSIQPSTLVSLSMLPNLKSLNVIGMMANRHIESLKDELPSLELNDQLLSTIARPTVGTRRTSIWGHRVREEL